MSKPIILIAEANGFSAAALMLLRRAGRVLLNDLDRPELLRAVAPVDVLWVRLRHRIDEELIERAVHLKVVVTPTTGLNHIDLQALANRNIRVLSLLGDTEFLKTVHATAEHTIGLVLSLIRHIPQAHSHVLGGGWGRDPFRGTELSGKTVGIVGYGRLGRIVARLFLAFEARVLASDPHVWMTDVDPGVQVVPLNELLQQSDIVSMHVNLDAETTSFFTKKHFAQMKRGAWFVNTARGELVDEAALLEKLQSGHLRGAALDVLSQERPAGMGDHPLVRYARDHDNLILTPHVGGCTLESMEKTETRMARKLCDLLAGKSTNIPSAPAATEAHSA